MAIAVYDDLVSRFGGTTELETQKLLAWALYNKGFALDRLHRNVDAAAAFDDVIARFSNASEPSLQEVVSRARVGGAIDRSGGGEDRHSLH